MEFDEQLKNAISRGQRKAQAEDSQQKKQQLSEQELRQRHNDFRLKLSEHIESSLKKLPEHFPGFTFETLYGDRGWGGALFRDDLTTEKSTGRGGSFYSRLEITVRPRGEYNIVDIAVKGTIHNKEVLAKNYHEDIQDASINSLEEKIDSWVLQYAERFAAV